jgi:hypothetical protein
MADNTPDKTEDDPSGQHDEGAMKDAERKMHATGTPDEDENRVDDPPGGHDKKALRDAAERMGVER